jgi:hypothetical protein
MTRPWNAFRNNCKSVLPHTANIKKLRIGMAGKIEPEAGKWYYRFDLGRNFTVTEIDEVRCVVKIQYLGGDIDEIALQEWDKLELQKAE